MPLHLPSKLQDLICSVAPYIELILLASLVADILWDPPFYLGRRFFVKNKGDRPSWVGKIEELPLWRGWLVKVLALGLAVLLIWIAGCEHFWTRFKLSLGQFCAIACFTTFTVMLLCVGILWGISKAIQGSTAFFSPKVDRIILANSLMWLIWGCLSLVPLQLLEFAGFEKAFQGLSLLLSLFFGSFATGFVIVYIFRIRAKETVYGLVVFILYPVLARLLVSAIAWGVLVALPIVMVVIGAIVGEKVVLRKRTSL